MRLRKVWIWCLLCAGLAGTAASQDKVDSPPVPDRLHIRAILTKTVKAAKAKAGDPVVLRATEAELVDGRILIPKDAKLTGRIVEAVPLSGEHESRLAILIERAEWKHHALPLHAFIVAQGQARTRTTSSCNPLDHWRNRQADRSLDMVCPDQNSDYVHSLKETPTVNDVEIRYVHGREGPTMLVSRKRNIVLEAGTLLLVRHTAPK